MRIEHPVIVFASKHDGRSIDVGTVVEKRIYLLAVPYREAVIVECRVVRHTDNGAGIVGQNPVGKPVTSRAVAAQLGRELFHQHPARHVKTRTVGVDIGHERCHVVRRGGIRATVSSGCGDGQGHVGQSVSGHKQALNTYHSGGIGVKRLVMHSLKHHLPALHSDRHGIDSGITDIAHLDLGMTTFA